MKKQMYWGLGVLMMLLIGAGVFLFVTTDRNTEPTVIYKDIEASKEVMEITEDTLPGARPGYKMVKHDDHYHEVPIAETEQPHDTNTSLPTVKHVPFSPPASDGMTVQARVAASDDVPKYAELKTMTDDELEAIGSASREKYKELSPEVDRLSDKYVQAKVTLTRNAKTPAEYDSILAAHSDTIIPLQEAYYAARREYFIHFEIASKALDVQLWRVTTKNKELINTSGYPAVIVNMDEPFD